MFATNFHNPSTMRTNMPIRLALINAALLTALIGCKQDKKENKMNIKAPIAKTEAKELVMHQDKRIDPYFWMRLSDEQKNAEQKDAQTQAVIDYLEAENAYLDTMLSHTKTFKEQLFQEIKARIKEKDESVPYLLDGYWYYTRFEEGQEYPIYCRKKGDMNASEEVMFNVNEMAKGFDYYQLSGVRVAPDNVTAMFFVDTVGRRQYTMQFKNLATGEIYGDNIFPCNGSAAWANDNKTVFYAINDPQTLRSFKVMRHTMGAAQSTDALAFHETDETYAVGVGKSKSKKFIYLSTSTTLADEWQYLDANNPSGKFSVIQPRTRDLEYNLEDYGDQFYIVTNLNAKNFRLMKTAINKPSKDNWQEVIAHREDVMLLGIEIFKNYLVIEERKEGLVNIRVKSWDNTVDDYIPFRDPSWSSGVSTNPEYDSEWLRYSYTSLTTPNSTYEWNMKTKENKLLKQTEVLGGFKVEDYVSERHYATAADGVKVPISLVYRKGLKKDGNNPCLLYGYGSYGASMDAYFSSVRLSLLDRGFVFAIAHIRGGQEMGRQWYEDGKLLKKKNTFTDFITCGEYLVQEKFTNSSKLFAEGGSAGGLLMGAIANMKPELWKGIVAAVPFVDVVSTMMDETIPLTTFEYDEWGNPADSVSYFYMKSYSPYDNVEAKNYPAMLVTTGFHDSQVQYWEPAKWVAKLRATKTDQNPLYLKTDMSTGHSGKTGRFERLKDIALEYVFMFDLLGITK
jgi:oligopeptidase B